MPELPDVTVYVEALEKRFVGRSIRQLQIRSPFVIRTFEIQPDEISGCRVNAIQRIGKRIAWLLERELFLVFHLMIAGRFHWKEKKTQPMRKVDLIALHFDEGTLLVTEASTKKRASLHIVKGADQLREFRRGELELFTATKAEFVEAMTRENRTLKRL